MIEFNVVDERIVVDKADLISYLNSQKTFVITYKGEVKSSDLAENDILIFKSKEQKKTASSMGMSAAPSLAQIFGSLYTIVEESDRVSIDASAAWSDIVALNSTHAHYDDTSSDGIMGFKDDVLEEIGWQAIEFKVTDREIAEVIEKECEGVLLSYHKESPFTFFALGFITDMECAREKARMMAIEVIKDKMANDEDYAYLDDDEEEAARYFGVI